MAGNICLIGAPTGLRKSILALKPLNGPTHPSGWERVRRLPAGPYVRVFNVGSSRAAAHESPLGSREDPT
jgi:hypothetical protein